MRTVILLRFFILFSTTLLAQSLDISVEDLRIEQSIEGGYYLYIRKNSDIASVLITESTEDPMRQTASYALRNPHYHYENGDELRILNNEVLENDGLYFLIDSSPVIDEQFGQAFRIFIPYIVLFGYEWSRRGEMQILNGSYLNIRAFDLPYADYRGSFSDNPFIIRVIQRSSMNLPEASFMDEAVESFSTIAESTNGKLFYSQGETDIIETIADILSDETGQELELILVLDNTQSMRDDMPALKNSLSDTIATHSSTFETTRIGIVYYRDYFEQFLYRMYPFESGTQHIDKTLALLTPTGGRDIPEAVNEALYAALTEFQWLADNRKIILIGDAPPHPRSQGKVTAEMIEQEAKNNNVTIHTIILPY